MPVNIMIMPFKDNVRMRRFNIRHINKTSGLENTACTSVNVHLCLNDAHIVVDFSSFNLSFI